MPSSTRPPTPRIYSRRLRSLVVAESPAPARPSDVLPLSPRGGKPGRGRGGATSAMRFFSDFLGKFGALRPFPAYDAVPTSRNSCQGTVLGGGGPHSYSWRGTACSRHGGVASRGSSLSARHTAGTATSGGPNRALSWSCSKTV